jgi:hypothetical protein
MLETGSVGSADLIARWKRDGAGLVELALQPGRQPVRDEVVDALRDPPPLLAGESSQRGDHCTREFDVPALRHAARSVCVSSVS